MSSFKLINSLILTQLFFGCRTSIQQVSRAGRHPSPIICSVRIQYWNIELVTAYKRAPTVITRQRLRLRTLCSFFFLSSCDYCSEITTAVTSNAKCEPHNPAGPSLTTKQHENKVPLVSYQLDQRHLPPITSPIQPNNLMYPISTNKPPPLSLPPPPLSEPGHLISKNIKMSYFNWWVTLIGWRRAVMGGGRGGKTFELND